VHSVQLTVVSMVTGYIPEFHSEAAGDAEKKSSLSTLLYSPRITVSTAEAWLYYSDQPKTLCYNHIHDTHQLKLQNVPGHFSHI